jgi:hypothetical protein
VSNRRGPNDCDLNFAELYPSAAAAFDYSAADDAKMDEIGQAHWGQWSDDEAKQMRDSRFTMRGFFSFLRRSMCRVTSAGRRGTNRPV